MTLVFGGADIKMVLLHEHKHEDGIKNFFLDVWEAYLKVCLALPFPTARSVWVFQLINSFDVGGYRSR